MSDVYAGWMEIEANMKGIQQTDFVKRLRDALEERGQLILKSPIVLASVFLDPRINIVMNAEDRSIASSVLVDLYQMRVVPIERSSADLMNYQHAMTLHPLKMMMNVARLKCCSEPSKQQPKVLCQGRILDCYPK